MSSRPLMSQDRVRPSARDGVPSCPSVSVPEKSPGSSRCRIGIDRLHLSHSTENPSN